MFTILLGFLVLGERPRLQQLLGVAVAFGGIALIGGAGLEGVGFLPFALTIAAAIAWGVANILSKKAGNIDMLSFTVWGNLVAPLPLLVLSVLFDGPAVALDALTHPSWQVAGMVAFLAYPNTLFGFAVWSNLLKRYPTASVAPFTLLVPVAGIASGVVFLGETIGPAELAGGALILLGLGLAVIRRREPAAYAGIKAQGG
jgi:O-acetylserine/cysteine efflux transporter